MTLRIAVVEDDESIREMLRYYFQSVGYTVRAYESGEALFEDAGQPLPVLYILDIMLPGMDGLEILRRLREGRETSEVPVIMLTARSEDTDKIIGFECGADDYITKPFNILELKARVRALLRRAGMAAQQSGAGSKLTMGHIVLDPDARAAWKDGKSVDLTAFTDRGAAQRRIEELRDVESYPAASFSFDVSRDYAHIEQGQIL